MNHLPERGNKFARASLILGVCAILSVFTLTVVPPMVLGSLSMILGLLSRGDTRFPHSSAMIGITLSGGAFVINIAICAVAFYFVFTNPEMTQMFIESMNETYEQMLGVSLYELLDSYGLGGILK